MGNEDAEDIFSFVRLPPRFRIGLPSRRHTTAPPAYTGPRSIDGGHAGNHTYGPHTGISRHSHRRRTRLQPAQGRVRGLPPAKTGGGASPASAPSSDTGPPPPSSFGRRPFRPMAALCARARGLSMCGCRRSLGPSLLCARLSSAIVGRSCCGMQLVFHRRGPGRKTEHRQARTLRGPTDNAARAQTLRPDRKYTHKPTRLGRTRPGASAELPKWGTSMCAGA